MKLGLLHFREDQVNSPVSQIDERKYVAGFFVLVGFVFVKGVD